MTVLFQIRIIKLLLNKMLNISLGGKLQLEKGSPMYPWLQTQIGT